MSEHDYTHLLHLLLEMLRYHNSKLSVKANTMENLREHLMQENQVAIGALENVLKDIQEERTVN